LAWAKGYLPWRTIWFWEPALQNILDDLFAQEKFDLMIVDDNAMANYHYPRSIPTILTEHEVRRSRRIDWSGLKGQNPLHWIYREIDWARWPRYERSVWRKFERIQVFTDKDAASMKELAPDLAPRIRVNPFGIQLPPPTDDSQEQDNTLLFTGNFTHPPNVDAALWLGREIMPLILKEIPQARLTLIGIYPPKEILALHSKEIDVLGPVPEIEPYEKMAALILAPVRIGGGMRMKVLHSMAMGKAVLTTPRGAEGLTVASEHPPVVIAQSAQEFSQSAVRLLSERSIRKQLGSEAREYINRHFTASAYARRIEDIYQEMVKRPA
jgi:polysaccharide biosynthesis protein PslH